MLGDSHGIEEQSQMPRHFSSPESTSSGLASSATAVGKEVRSSFCSTAFDQGSDFDSNDREDGNASN